MSRESEMNLKTFMRSFWAKKDRIEMLEEEKGCGTCPLVVAEFIFNYTIVTNMTVCWPRKFIGWLLC